MVSLVRRCLILPIDHDDDGAKRHPQSRSRWNRREMAMVFHDGDPSLAAQRGMGIVHDDALSEKFVNGEHQSRKLMLESAVHRRAPRVDDVLRAVPPRRVARAHQKRPCSIFL